VRASRSPSVSVLVVALAWSTSALISVAAGVTSFAVIAAFCSAVAMGIELARVFSSEKHTDDAVIARLVKQAEAGRRLAIYDRDTGLFAHWYRRSEARKSARAPRDTNEASACWSSNRAPKAGAPTGRSDLRSGGGSRQNCVRPTSPGTLATDDT
jgi:hypothetical protein